MPYKILILTEAVVKKKKKNYISFVILDVRSLEMKTMTEVLTYYMFL